jgi:precorrin-4/cobalt-precorrin-4 C11-methyltransferase
MVFVFVTGRPGSSRRGRSSATSAKRLKNARVTRTALVLVGRALASESAAASRLYAADHYHSMRPRRRA